MTTRSTADERPHHPASSRASGNRPTPDPVALNKCILRRPVGGPEIMAGQLDRLAESAELHNVSLRVVPFAAGFHLGQLTGPFEILRFPQRGRSRKSEPPTVYADGFTRSCTWISRARSSVTPRRSKPSGNSPSNELSSKNLIHQAAEELGNRYP